MRSAALHFGAEHHLLDHIAPLAALLNMPLLVDEEPVLAELYYPQVKTQYWPDLNLSWKKLAERFECLFRCGFWSPHLKEMLRHFHEKEMRFIFCPHGQSDKGFHSPLLAPYAEQEMVLLYGPLMQQMLKSLGIWSEIQNKAFIGNYRQLFYQRNRAFYDNLVEKTVFSQLDPEKPVLLYAPTWQDSEQSSSFYFASHLIEETPAHWNLIIKPHPLLESRDPARYYALARATRRGANILLLEQFPPIYPLLERTDVYLGDFSSIGYDFLAYERPMFFLNPSKRPETDPSRRLHKCGLVIDPMRPFAYIEENLSRMDKWIPAQQSLYRSVYADCPEVRESVDAALRGYC